MVAVEYVILSSEICAPTYAFSLAISSCELSGVSVPCVDSLAFAGEVSISIVTWK